MRPKVLITVVDGVLKVRLHMAYAACVEWVGPALAQQRDEDMVVCWNDLPRLPSGVGILSTPLLDAFRCVGPTL